MLAYKDSERNTWFIRCSYKDYKGDYKKTTKRGFSTKKEALEWERQFKIKDHYDDTTPFVVICEKYYTEHINVHRASTLQMYRTHINNNIKPFFSDMPLTKVDKNIYLKWREWLLKDKQREPSYIEKCETVVRTLYSYGLAELGINKNCLINIKKLRNTAPKKEMQFWTYAEFQQFISVVDDFEMQLTFEILYNSGIRCGEFLALTGGDFDLSTQTMKISKSFRRINGQDIISAPKTNKGNRNISMPQFVFDLLNTYTSKIFDYDPQNRLFQFSKHKITLAMDKYSKIANVKRIRIHDLRHSHASFLINENYPTILISERLGHEKVSITLDIYGHLFPSRDMEISNILDEMFKKRSQNQKNSTNIDK